MNPNQIRRIFPNASASVLAANASDYGSGDATAPDSAPQTPPARAETPKPPGKHRKCMNKTETAFAAILHGQQMRGEIKSFRFEGVRLKWGHDEKTGEAMNYKPDFFVDTGWLGMHGPRFKCIEVKGAHIFDRDLVRFKGCRAEWPEFVFDLFQWKNGEWKQIH